MVPTSWLIIWFRSALKCGEDAPEVAFQAARARSPWAMRLSESPICCRLRSVLPMRSFKAWPGEEEAFAVLQVKALLELAGRGGLHQGGDVAFGTHLGRSVLPLQHGAGALAGGIGDRADRQPDDMVAKSHYEACGPRKPSMSQRC